MLPPYRLQSAIAGPMTLASRKAPATMTCFMSRLPSDDAQGSGASKNTTVSRDLTSAFIETRAYGEEGVEAGLSHPGHPVAQHVAQRVHRQDGQAERQAGPQQ